MKAGRKPALQTFPLPRPNSPSVGDSDAAHAAPAPRNRKPPTIQFARYEEFCEGLDRPFLCKLASQGGGLVLQDYECLLKKLQGAGEEYTTQTPRQDKPERFVVMRLPTGIATENVHDALIKAQLPA